MKILTIWTGFLAASFFWTLQPNAVHKDPVFLTPEETARRLKGFDIRNNLFIILITFL